MNGGQDSELIWRLDALGVGIRRGRALHHECLAAIMPADRLRGLFLLTAMGSGLAAFYAVRGLFDSRPSSRPMRLMLDPLMTVMRDAATEELAKRPREELKRMQAEGPPPEIAPVLSKLVDVIETESRTWDDPLPFWSGCALGIVAEGFPALGLTPVEIHACTSTEDANAVFADLQAGREPDPSREYDLNPTRH